MRKVSFILSTMLIFSVFFGNISVVFSDNCSNGVLLLQKGLSDSPNEMTNEFFSQAIRYCPDSADFYLKIAEYYEHWYKNEPNPEKQGRYKTQSEKFYQEALSKIAVGEKHQAIKTKLAEIQSSEDFNVAAFRALRPSNIGATGTGLEIKVSFKLNSYELDEAQQKHLDQLGSILSSDKNLKISLEGHTDMSGEREYNQKLSELRAESVRKYLVYNFNVSPEQVNSVGFGYSRPINKKNPYSASNRRVEVIKLRE